MFDACIFVSGEDDKYLVHGGIGTYLGVLTRSIKQCYPSTTVIWISRAPDDEDIREQDRYGVQRIYLGAWGEVRDLPFATTFPYLVEDRTAKYASFLHRVEETLVELLDGLQGKRVLLEVGEWEGQAQGIFRALRDKNVLKVARLHTPLAVCMAQNTLPQTSTNALQMLNEYQQIKHADMISSCTDYMRAKVIREVLGDRHPLASTIVTIPNPIDVDNYAVDRFSRDDSFAFLNELRSNVVNAETYNIFIIGSVETRKGVEHVVKAIPEVAEAIPSVRFCFFGHHAPDDGSWSNANAKWRPKDLYALIPPHYRHYLTFFNYIPHEKLPLVLPSGDLFPILSLGDNFPGTVAEIALMAKPIVALEKGGVKEMLCDLSGTFQALSLGEDLSMASSRLSRTLIACYSQKDLREQIGLGLRKLFLEKYRPDAVVEEMMEAYMKAWAQKNGR